MIRKRAGSLTLLIGNVLPALTGIATAPLTSRALGPHDRASVVVCISVAGVFVVVDSLGLPWRARYQMISDPLSAAMLSRQGLRLTVLSLAPAALLGLATCHFLGVDGLSRTLAIVFFVCQAGAAWLGVRASIVLTQRPLALLGTINIVASTAVVAAIFALLAFGRLTVGTALAANSLAVLIQLGCCVAASKPAVRASRCAVVRITARWASSWSAQIADVVAARADVLIATTLYASTAIGLYSVASILTVVSYQLGQTVIQRDLRTLAGLADDRRAFVVALRTLLIVNAVVAGIGVLAGWLLIRPVFGSAFADSVSYLPGVAVLCVGLGAIAAVLFDASRRNAPFAVPLLYVGAPLVGAAVVSALLSPPLTVYPVVLGAFYLATAPVRLVFDPAAGVRSGREVRRPRPFADEGVERR